MAGAREREREIAWYNKEGKSRKEWGGRGKRREGDRTTERKRDSIGKDEDEAAPIHIGHIGRYAFIVPWVMVLLRASNVFVTR